MRYRFEFRPYRRRFLRPLTTSHGTWDIRDGIILCLSDETNIGWGEIAPISWFGSETIEQALSFCRQLPTEITEETIFSIPDELPACQFGFESALWEGGSGGRGRGEWGDKGTRGQGGQGGQGDRETRRQGDNKNNSFPPSPPLPFSPSPPLPFSPSPHPHSLTYSGLLPAGEAVLEQWQKLWEQGYRTFKWKIGVYAIASELKIFELLTQALPSRAKLRLDANGGLSYEDANLWLWTCDNIHINNRIRVEIEFLEQPLRVDQFQRMLELSYCYETKIALDESVATLKQLECCFQQGWRDIFVIKPGIVGSPSRLRQFCQQHKIDAVFSSVFETEIGRQAALELAGELSQHNRAVGFGVNHFFEQEKDNWLENLWKF
ncbi:mandelate racemase/muconate lactonizing protein [Tolypothrix sp. NIES-4075]|uniref:o-succinylbenzoate synthase n=1 Tax=Tolypothrix sp. NIES-4075 TaxID=2005459 RepID=UPI000B5C28EB|nr:o-succinylbenzoate synthase [Tolypothrix sp. NIES-4075]GAX42973.1 mandelate racemase/muconate lactonizing protein [Tolypothrix sp. NIES-4075]